MRNRFNLTILAAVLVGGGLEAIVGLALLHRTAPIEASRACFNIGENVCLSGSTEWVAHAAAASPRPFGAMSTMLADAN